MIRPLPLAVRLALAWVALALVSLAPRPALAWDQDATRLVGELAYQRLTPQARTRVDQILAGAGPVGRNRCRVRTLADAPDLASCLHGQPGDFMRGVIYDPIPLCPGAQRVDPCRKGDCASTVLKGEVARLKDPATTPADRAVALEAVAYLTAELHQPLHAVDNGDRGGERFHVVLPGSSDRRLDLNGVWDQDLVASAIGNAETGLAYVAPLADAHAAEWSAGDIDGWVADTHQVAVKEVYGRLPAPPQCGRPPETPERLDRGYIDYGAQVVRTQLAKAAVRLATLLNAALG